MVQAFTHAPAMVDGQRGGKFRLLDGNVFGEFTELVRHSTFRTISRIDYIHVCIYFHLHMKWINSLKKESSLSLSLHQVPDEKIVMKWRYNNWPSGMLVYLSFCV